MGASLSEFAEAARMTDPEDAGADGRGSARTILFSAPGVHCASCISVIEQDLGRQPGVLLARVNLSQKRIYVTASESIDADSIRDRIAGLGFKARELEARSSASNESEKVGFALLVRVGVAGFALFNVMLFSVVVWSGAEGATRSMMQWLSALIALPALAYSASPFFISAGRALSNWRMNMDTPISLAIALAASMSLFETWQNGEHVYFDAALALTFFLLAGRYFDERTRTVARSAAEELAALEPNRAIRLDSGVETEVPVDAVRIGDLVLARPGERIPVDGVVAEGHSELDKSFLTGESRPVPVGPNEAVAAGEMNLTGRLNIRVSAAGEDTSLRKIANLVALAERTRSKYASLASKAALIYAPAIHLAAATAFAVWFIGTGDARVAVNVAIALLIITCPCALGLAVPAVSTAASGKLFRERALLKSPTALERLASVDTVVFDKTGTLTVTDTVLADPARHDPESFAIAAALAESSNHPYARALARHATANGIKACRLEEVRERPGFGIEGRYGLQPVRLGSAGWVGVADDAGNATYLKVGGQEPTRFAFVNRMRSGASRAIRELKEMGLEVQVLSGDTAAAVEDAAARLGIECRRSERSPAEKSEIVQELAGNGRKVLMVGDGLNDTGALAFAHASMSPASALDAARVVSDIVLLDPDLQSIPRAIKISRKAKNRILENFGIAACYNLIAVPVAFLGLATPLAAAIAMSASSISVTLNAMRLK